MQEQPPSESPRREPAERARRRSPRPTFRPPTTAEQAAAAEPAAPGQPTTGEQPPAKATPRPRRAKAAPTVLFQPPAPEPPLPPKPRRAPAPTASDPTPRQPVSAANPEQPAPPAGTSPEHPEPSAPPANDASPEPSETPEGTEPTVRTPKARATPARKAAAQKAVEVTPTTPKPRKRAASPTKRAAAPGQSATAQEAAPEPPTAVIATSARTPESELRAVASRVLDHPGFAPELLALAAVRALGPGAAEWAAGLRTRYPDASADGLARLATRRFVRSAGAGGATAALAGFFAPLAELTSVLWTHANLVLHLAAAYGKDPTHPDRAVELLVLTQVHPDAASAAAALAAAQEAGDPVEAGWPRAAEAAWRLAAPLTAQTGGWVALRLVARLLPGAAMLAAALGDAAAADRLAARAVAAYRPARR
ncbi:hypothetical protein [Micromonospora sp. WMMD1155]|uniref:hypothetical protein n=1 Tax=Micromonospora sp. WMMD1155 TaxID=3016094 RepID=UPI00249BD932|nr:hypothetical protein [Micromonospora sp. WMMD1155]WFE51151.1 hypothetical protein O7617_12815 [Micromonospora sp. WMMD1155]